MRTAKAQLNRQMCTAWSDSWLPAITKSRCSSIYVSTNNKCFGVGVDGPKMILTLVMLNPDISCLCKQCRSRSVGFWRSQLIWICTVCHNVCESIATIQIKQSDWLKLRSGCGTLIYSAGQGLKYKRPTCSKMPFRFCGMRFLKSLPSLLLNTSVKVEQNSLRVPWHSSETEN